jgi:hypothetical protein
VLDARSQLLRAALGFATSMPSYDRTLYALREDKSDQLHDAECVWLYDHLSGKLIGETYGVPVDAFCILFRDLDGSKGWEADLS